MYEKGKIYKIVNDINAEIYVGSTCKTLAQRMGSHRSVALVNKSHMKIYTMMNELGKEHFRIILVENYPTDSKDKLRAREDYFINELKPTLNIKGAILNVEKQKARDKKYKEEHKEHIKERDKKYKEEHKEHIKERENKYNMEHKQEKSEYNKIYGKKYREDNKEKIREAKKKAYQEKKKQI